MKMTPLTYYKFEAIQLPLIYIELYMYLNDELFQRLRVG